VTANREDAEDIVQQSVQKAFTYLQTFEGRSSFCTWLTRIAVNEALMCMRTNRRTSTVSIDEVAIGEENSLALQIPDLGPSPEYRCSQKERQRLLFVAMDQLSPGIRTAIQLFELDERPLKESAQMLGVSISAVKSRVLRGRRKLRETLNRRVSPTRIVGNETSQVTADTNQCAIARGTSG
jgi:RNA polymerase sigma-70 factor (ECF subfamily)